ncbi:hypothetical protein SNE40_005799 [Patella caerulea]|uniref:sn-1-specific diacylglycerol lipase n=1 Tax=Patella caerulea TaxID=87958 RepID=A0AAN8K595_PATCE
MPGLVMFRRRWSVGSDDFVYPNFLEIILRLAWLIAISVVFCINRDNFTCQDANLLKIYYIGLLIIQILNIIVAITIMVVSMKGTIAVSEPRSKMALLLYIKLGVLVPECVWVVLGTYWAYGYTYACPEILVWMVKGAVICSWIVGFIVLVVIFIIFDPMGEYHQKNRLAKRTPEGALEYQSDAAKKAWERRIKVICCCVANNQENRDAFIEISKLVADFFVDVDLVPTDIAAGLILVKKQQAWSASQLISVVIDSPSSSNLQPQNTSRRIQPPKPWMTIKLMRHYMTFAAGSYGWPYYVYNNLGTGLCKILKRSRCCSCIRKEDHVVSDNACSCNTAGILMQTGLDRKDLIYVSYHNKVAEIPFFVAVDRKENKVVIAIRGTMSLEDALTDLSAVGVNVHVEGVMDCYVHCGMLKCALYIESQLKELQLIEKAFDALPEATGLVITGHSLGAGAAAILAMKLRPDYPDLICYAFSPPGGLLSPNASQHAQDYICSVILGKDVIPRLGMPTMNKLKCQILKALAECRHPKYRILAGGCFRQFCDCLMKDQLHSNHSSKSYDVESTGLLIEKFKESLKTAFVNTNSMVNDVEWPMHPPGQILHIIEEEEESGCCGKPTFSAVWAHPDDFNEIIISHKMVFDHMPEDVLGSLTSLEKSNFIPIAQLVPDNGDSSTA